MTKKRFYLAVVLYYLAGLFWLIVSSSSVELPFGCIFKHTSGLPCPSCGTTRSLLCIFQGNIWEAMYWNPMGIFWLIIILILPVWLIYDWLRQRTTFQKAYQTMEASIRKKKVFIPLLFLIGANWVWNIMKGI